jgi:hypothetical protein
MGANMLFSARRRKLRPTRTIFPDIQHCAIQSQAPMSRLRCLRSQHGESPGAMGSTQRIEERLGKNGLPERDAAWVVSCQPNLIDDFLEFRVMAGRIETRILH